MRIVVETHQLFKSKISGFQLSNLRIEQKSLNKLA